MRIEIQPLALAGVTRKTLESPKNRVFLGCHPARENAIKRAAFGPRQRLRSSPSGSGVVALTNVPISHHHSAETAPG